MAFSEIVGHLKQVEALRTALVHGRLHHAYLFVGPEGVGKRTIALSLARAVHCDESNDDFCGRCANCARIQAGNHPDVRVTEPLPGKKEISIQQIREIQKDLNFRSFSGRRKIAVIDPAILMSLPAQNALLKTLEEPPQDSVLILVASNGGALLSTLRSRCLRLSFGPLERDLLAGFLAAKNGVRPNEADLLAAIAMGSLGKAVRIDSEELRERRSIWMDTLSTLGSGDYRAATQAAEDLANNREESLAFLEWAETWYRDLLIHAVTESSRDIVNLDMLMRIQEQGRADLEHILSSIARIIESSQSIQRNLNRRMVLESLFLSLVGARS